MGDYSNGWGGGGVHVSARADPGGEIGFHPNCTIRKTERSPRSPLVQEFFGIFYFCSPSHRATKTASLSPFPRTVFASRRISSVAPVTSNVNKLNGESHTGTVSPPDTGEEARYAFKFVGTHVWFVYISL